MDRLVNNVLSALAVLAGAAVIYSIAQSHEYGPASVFYMFGGIFALLAGVVWLRGYGARTIGLLAGSGLIAFVSGEILGTYINDTLIMGVLAVLVCVPLGLAYFARRQI